MTVSLFSLFAACGFGPDARSVSGALSQEADPCASVAAGLPAPVITPTSDPLVFRAEWETDGTGETWALFRDSEGWALSTPMDGSGVSSHDMPLLGLHADESYDVQVAWSSEAGLACSEVTSFETAPLAPNLPELQAWLPDGAAPAAGFTAVGVISEWTYWAALIDGAGEYVWVREVPTLTERATYLASSQTVAVNVHARSVDEPGGVEFYRLGVNEPTARMVDGAHTDFVFLPDGSYATLVWDLRVIGKGEDARKLLGDKIVEVAPDGSTREVWNAWDHFEVDIDQDYLGGMYVDPDVDDWSHVNGLSYDQERDAYLVSISGLLAVASVQRTTGEMNWMLSSIEEYDDFDAEPHGRLVDDPHSVFRTSPDRYLLFNRRLEEGCSQAREVQLDLDDGVARSTWVHESEDCLTVAYLGSAEQLPTGNRLIAWSSAGRIDEVTPEGDVVWQVGLDLGAAFGFAQHVTSLY